MYFYKNANGFKLHCNGLR